MGKAKNESWDWRDTGEKVSMSEKVGKILSSLKDTACVHMTEREAIAMLKFFDAVVPEGERSKDDEEFFTWLNKDIIPALQELGYARWYRDVITDLGLALSGAKKDDKGKVSAKSLDID